MRVILLPILAALAAQPVAAYKNWDLYLFRPGCNPEDVDIGLYLYHRIGTQKQACQRIDNLDFNLTDVDSLSWKSPVEERAQFDLCMFKDAKCNKRVIDEVRNQWDICHPYNGWKSYKVVPIGAACK
ncbi:hypothetical protein FE257_004260 [Aspergillus nanangensis]|uniref:Uncharacterized protein n=1 Tax=Aspergillus nanangensis TaxID=2582783 RepID=A0AAD4GV76_ASPNN|nr:hypothetical protein FE257_004260 [Aspergillus nanangensis]